MVLIPNDVVFRLADQLEDAARNLQRTADELRELLAPPAERGESLEGKGLDSYLEQNPPPPLPKPPPPPPTPA